jgi:uncharacterized protein (DUF58 family)
VGIAALAVICCGAAPLLLALFGGLAVGAVLGLGAGLIALVTLAALALAARRRRRAECEVPPRAPGRP